MPGQDNPADVASRGCRPRRLSADPTWFHGPSFLLSGPEPEQPTLIEDAAVREELISFENHLRKVTLFQYAVKPRRVTPFMVHFLEDREFWGRGLRILSLVVEATLRLRREPLVGPSGESVYEEVERAVLIEMIGRHQQEHWAPGTSRTETKRGNDETPLTAALP